MMPAHGVVILVGAVLFSATWQASSKKPPRKAAPAPGEKVTAHKEDGPSPSLQKPSVQSRSISIFTGIFNQTGSFDSLQEKALDVLEAVTDADFKRLPFAEVEQLVYKSWWKVSTKVVVRSHSARIDFTPAVRVATGEVKRQADSLLRWLDPAFANPSPTAMAAKWAQNTTAVMFAARFSPKWDGPGGANVAVFSSEKGRGHIDKQRTTESVKEQLRVNISHQRIEAEITAHAGNTRKRFLLNVSLFDEVVPQHSFWYVDYRRAQGSMQMSSGALIPEVHFMLRKRWPGVRLWPRPAVMGVENGGTEPTWWNEAPGASRRSDTDATGDFGVELVATPLTCAASSEIFCAPVDSCVTSCAEQCAEAPQRHSWSPRCVGRLAAFEVQQATFHDDDLRAGLIGGLFHFEHEVYVTDSAEMLSLHWGLPSMEAVPHASPIQRIEAIGDPRPIFEVPNGTAPPAGATHFLVIASSEAASPTSEVLVALEFVDRVYPSPPRGLSFQDSDPAANSISGFAELQRADHEKHVESYEVHFGAQMGDKSIVAVEGPAIARSVVPTDGAESSIPLLLVIRENASVPYAASYLIAFAIGSGGVRSEGAFIRLVDASPPTHAPAAMSLSSDLNRKLGVLRVTATITGRTCPDEGLHRAKCDLGDEYVIYFSNSDRTLMGSAIAKVASTADGDVYGTHVDITDVDIPPGATSLQAIARNKHGEMSHGPSETFFDDKTETLEAWVDVGVLLSTHDGTSSLWKPFKPGQDIAHFNSEFSSEADSENVVTALALDDPGNNAYGGRDDGSIHCLEVSTNRIWRVVQGTGGVTSLAVNGAKQAIRGAREGVLDAWDLKVNLRRRLDGHTDDIQDIKVDWTGMRAATASLDGSVRIWDLRKASSIGVLWGNESGSESVAGMASVAVDWRKSLAVSASYDNMLRLWNLKDFSLTATLQGHREAAIFVSVDWDHMQALSMSDDRSMKLWDLQSFECIRTFQEVHESPILAVHVQWSLMQVMVVVSDGMALLLDLKTSVDNVLDSTSFHSALQVASIASAPVGRE